MTTNKTMAYALSAVLLASAGQAQAIGVPTLDGTSAALLMQNGLEQAQQAMDALNEAKKAVEQAKAQYDHYKRMVEGNDRLGDFLSDPSLNRTLPMGEWSDVYSSARDISGLRNRYGLVSSDSGIQARFDQMLAVVDALERNYDASTQRVNNAEQLRARLNEVQTPQQREELQLRYQQEYIEQQNQQMRLANMQMLQEQKDTMENQRRAQAFEDYMMGRTKTLPKY